MDTARLAVSSVSVVKMEKTANLTQTEGNKIIPATLNLAN